LSLLKTLLVVAGLLLAPAILAGLVRRRLYRLCYSFPTYLLTVWIGELLIFAWPERFYHWTFWQIKETAYAVLKLATALELGSLAFKAFPGARRRAMGLALLVLLATLGTLVLEPVKSTDVESLALELQPRLANGTALLFASVWALVFWYHIPLHRLHRAILRGIVPYLLIFTTGMRLLASLGRDIQHAAAGADSIAYVALLAYWAWEAWRKEPEDTASSPVLRRLQPWRDRL